MAKKKDKDKVLGSTGDYTFTSDGKYKKRNSVSRFEVVETDASKLTVEEESAIGASRVTELREKDKALMEEMQKEKEREEKNKKVRKWLKIGIVILIILLLIARCSAGYTSPDDRNRVDIGLQEIETPAPEESRKPEVDLYRGMYASMNPTPIFEDGLSQGTLFIVNDKENLRPQYVELFLLNKTDEKDKNGEPKIEEILIYRSGALMPGTSLIKDTLDVNLPAGTYNCLARFYALTAEKDLDTGEYTFYREPNAGWIEEKITVYVKNTNSGSSVAKEAGENG